MKSKKSNYLFAAVSLAPVMIGSAFADASTVTNAVTGLTADASAGVAAGLGIGVILFGARVVWRAVKGMAK
jgi:hypothetical protein